jgi:hypothetical protein
MDYGGLHDFVVSEFRAAKHLLDGTIQAAKLMYSKS